MAVDRRHLGGAPLPGVDRARRLRGQKHLDIRGCWGSDFSHFYRGVEMLKTPRGRALWSEIELERYELSRINEALSDVAEGRCVKALVVPKR